MAGGKYEKYLMEAPIIMNPDPTHPQVPGLFFRPTEGGAPGGFAMVPITEASLIADKPHKHDFHQLLMFVGSDPYNIGDLGAEIEFSLGEEEEKHVITTPTVVHIPPGLVHAPLNYKRIDKPIYHLDVYFTPDYKRLY